MHLKPFNPIILDIDHFHKDGSGKASRKESFPKQLNNIRFIWKNLLTSIKILKRQIQKLKKCCQVIEEKRTVNGISENNFTARMLLFYMVNFPIIWGKPIFFFVICPSFRVAKKSGKLSLKIYLPGINSLLFFYISRFIKRTDLQTYFFLCKVLIMCKSELLTNEMGIHHDFFLVRFYFQNLKMTQSTIKSSIWKN